MFNRIVIVSVFIFIATIQGHARPPAEELRMSPFSAPLPDDNFQVFLENLTTINNIFQFESISLTQGKTQLKP